MMRQLTVDLADNASAFLQCCVFRADQIPSGFSLLGPLFTY